LNLNLYKANIENMTTCIACNSSWIPKKIARRSRTCATTQIASKSHRGDILLVSDHVFDLVTTAEHW